MAQMVVDVMFAADFAVGGDVDPNLDLLAHDLARR
jgi:hypothetical protein